MHRTISTKNFQYQTTSYFKSSFAYSKTDKEAEEIGSSAGRKVLGLGKESDIASIRNAIRSAYEAKERCISKEWRLKISGKFNQFFRTYPEKAKWLSRQDICALILIDMSLIDTYKGDSLHVILDGFKSMNHQDFKCLDVSIAFLKVANISVVPRSEWLREKEEWALKIAEEQNAMGISSVGIRSTRLTALGVRKRDSKIIDKSIALLEKAKAMMVRARDRKDADTNIAYMKKQKVSI